MNKMNYTLEDVVNDHPKLYRNTKYIACGQGWADLIYELSSKLEPLIDSEEMYASQIKEKYGQLRLYMSLYNEEIDALIEQATKDSKRVCEMCGDEGSICTIGHWVTVRCQDCKQRFL